MFVYLAVVICCLFFTTSFIGMEASELIGGLIQNIGLISSCCLQLCATMLRAFGPMALVAAPAYAWGVPVLIIFCLLQTSNIRLKPPQHEH